MPPLSRRYLIAAALFLVAGVGTGLWLLIAREFLGQWPSPYHRSVHLHLILVGAVMQTILGTALWFFPRPPRSERRPREWQAELAWWCLSGGTAARAVAEWFRSGSPDLRWVIVAGGAIQVAGFLFGIIALRPRIRSSARV